MGKTSKSQKEVPAGKKTRVVFKKESKDYRSLLLLMKNGGIREGDQPAAVHEKYNTQFGKYTLNQFRCQFNHAKAQHKLENQGALVAAPAATATNNGDDSDDDDDNEEELNRYIMEQVGSEPPSKASGKKSPSLNVFGNDNFDAPPCWRPKRIVATYENEDGVQCAAIIIANTAGCIDKSLRKVEINCSEDCMGIVVSEEYSDGMLDSDTLHRKLPPGPNESQVDCLIKALAVKSAIRKLREKGLHKSIYRIDSPFRIEPTEMRVKYMGTGDDSRFIHIDICSQKKKDINQVLFYDEKESRSDNQFLPSSAAKEYNNLG